MSNPDFEARLALLETEVAHLKQQVATHDTQTPWWTEIVGTFADDPMYQEAVRLGREYRQSLRFDEDIRSES
jgi:hypothetical protein